MHKYVCSNWKSKKVIISNKFMAADAVDLDTVGHTVAYTVSM